MAHDEQPRKKPRKTAQQNKPSTLQIMERP
ncbi:hypothetical protein COLO4_12676 [Corchorus olitorius]|uniref:Uncharacterized protein n=1 Tax=Corchorus olitorius TaxID=93759 RepID=A0A1R3K039_9ROSI|nr:hypothetical protein COLO4_12676 [Corchorus olitorius]